MKIYTKLAVIALLLTVIFSISAISAAENVTLDNDDANIIQDQALSLCEPVEETKTEDLKVDETHANEILSSKIEEDVLTADNESNLLAASGSEDVLGIKTIVPSGEHCQDIRNAIATASDGDIIDLQGKTFTIVDNGDTSISSKKLTFINGVIDGRMQPQGDNKRTFLTNCNLENITFKNYRVTSTYSLFFTNCYLKNVVIDNFDLNTAGFVIRDCIVEGLNVTNCHSRMPEDHSYYEIGAMVVAYTSSFDNCNFINSSTNRHSGAICVAGEPNNVVNISNSNFINCSAGVGGAVYVHGNDAVNENYHSNIVNCKFINCHATEWGGALGSSQNYLNVENCEFINNTAKQGAAFMVGGISHGLDGIWEGHYNTMKNCYFYNNAGSDEGGAVHITGNYNSAIDCTFVDNYAINGNGAAIYVEGYSASVINSEFYEHQTDKGTVYIEGNNASIIDSIFKDNVASSGGAGVYIHGNNSLIDNTYFKNNNATIHGGAVHVVGNNATIKSSQFISNNAIPHPEDVTQGLGGAIYIKGDDNEIVQSYFDQNTARNGSAIYNRGKNLHINAAEFIENQAWSYLLVTLADPEFSYYQENNPINVSATLISGDNIINAIYNDGKPEDIWFHNVTYESSKGTRTTKDNEIHPAPSVDESDGGNKIYQDSREDLQILTINVTNDETGKEVFFTRDYTGIHGNLSAVLNGLPSGNYTVTAHHPEDMLYKEIRNTTKFRIEPQADLEVTKVVSDNHPKYLDEITWTITVFNKGPSDAENVYLKDLLPNGLVHISDDSQGEYDVKTGVWRVGNLSVNGEARIVIRTLVNSSNVNITNIAVANSTTYDPNETNNKDNDTIDVDPVADLAVEKIVSNHHPKQNEEITWTIRVTNNGPDTAVNVKVRDVIPEGLELIGTYENFKNNVWTIGNLTNKQSVVLQIKTKVLVTNTNITNIANVTGDTPDNNLTNNEDNDTIDVGHEADLEVIKTVSNSTPKYGDIITWNITVINHGPDKAIDVVVTDKLPAGLIYITHTSGFNYNPVSGIWDIGELENNNASVTLLITAKVNITNATITNIAVVNSTTYDPNDTNNEDNETIGVDPVADLVIEKIVSNKYPKFGEEIIWTIKVTNKGPDVAVNAKVTDILPKGLIYVDGEGKYNPATNTWFIGNLTFNETVTLNIKTRVNVTAQVITNIANVTSDTPDNNLTNNEDNETVDIGHEADLEVIKIVSNSTPKYGDIITWNITVINHGPNDAVDVKVIDNLPKGLIYVNHTKGLKYENGIWDIGELKNNANITLTITTKVNVSNSNLTNIANVTSDTHDPNPDNNKDNDTIKVSSMADVIVTKIVSNSTPKFGDEITWTITVHNNGPDTAENVIVKDKLPEGLVYVSDDGKGAYNHSTGIWNVGNLAHNHGLILKIVTRVNITNKTITNVAVANSTTYDPNETNNKGNNTTEINPEADVIVTKVVSNANPKFGEEVKWTITVLNKGPDAAENVIVKDKLPEGLIFNGADGDYNPTTGIWNVGYLKHNEEVILVIKTIVNITNKTITNIAVVNSTTYDPNETNNEDNGTVDVDPVADLAIEKVVSNPYPKKDEEITWIIKVTNKGPDVAVNAKVTDVLPKGLIYVDGEGKYNPATNTWFIGNLTFNETVTLNIKTRVNVTAQVITNIANVTSDTPDNNLTNNEDNETVDIGHEADLEVIKIVSNSTPKYGDIISWNITVINHGPDDAVDVKVTDNLPKGLIYVNHTKGLKYENGIWEIGELKNNTSITLIIFTQVNITNATVTNVAVVNSSTHDKNESNNNDNDTITVDPVADLQIIKTVNNHNPKKGETVIWTINVTNNGPDTAINVSVTDIIPDGLELMGTYENFTNNIWSVGNLANKQSAILEITTKVLESNKTITNIANVTSDTPDNDLTNNEDNDTIDVGHEADLEVIKTVSNPTPKYGEIITWNITVINHGKDIAVDVSVVDKLPKGLIYINHTAGYNYNHENGIWDIGELKNKTAVTLLINTRVNVTNTNLTNVAIVNSSTHDPNETNNEDNDTIEVPPTADLEVIKTVSKTVSKYGEIITWTITVFNHGPDTAKNVTVKDELPRGLVYVIDDGDGAYNHITGIWNVGDLANHRGLVLNIQTLVNITNKNITNVAVANSTTYDPNETNNKGNNTTDVEPKADLVVVKIVSNTTSRFNQTIEWTIKVTNNGPDTAVNVKVIDKLPAGLIFKGSDGDYNADTGVWNVGNLTVKESRTLVITTLVNTTDDTIVNVANVTSDTPGNRTNATNKTTVPAEADLVIQKLVSKNVTKKGEEIIWTIIVTNNGPNDATNVNVRDFLPEGLIFNHRFTVTRGTFNYQNLVWHIPLLINGHSETLTLLTIVNTTNKNLTNVANVTSDTYDPNKTNNEANNTTEAVPEADLEIIKTVSNSTAMKGDIVNWTITVINRGPDAAVNVKIVDELPDGIKNVNGSNKIVIVLPSLESGKNHTVVIQTIVEVSGKTIVNIVNVTSDTRDPDESNNEDNDTVVVTPIADLTVVKTVSNSNPHKGDIITWTIAVTNNGPDAAKNVLVEDMLPNGLKFVSGDVSRDNNRVYKIIDKIANGETVKVTFKTLVDITNVNLTNIAVVSSNDTYDPNKTNDEDNETIKVDPEADLSITKTVSDSNPKKGDVITWTIVVRNNGPDTAENVVVKEKLPNGLHVIRISGSKGTYSENTLTIGNLTNGQTATLTITTRVMVSGTKLENMVVVNSSTYDPDESNNEDKEVTNPEENETSDDDETVPEPDDGAFGPVPNDDDPQPPVNDNPDKGDSPKTMHATGNPIIIVILALLAVCGVGLRRRI